MTRADIERDAADVLDDLVHALLSGRSSDDGSQGCRDGLHILGDRCDLIRDVVERRGLRALNCDRAFRHDHGSVGRAGIELDVLLAEEAEVRDARAGVRAKRHIVVHIHRHFGAAVGKNANVFHVSFSDARDAHGRLVFESRNVIEDGLHLARRARAAQADVFDPEDEIAEHGQRDQHHDPDFCC
jgi:hypothetical protein